MKSLLRFFPISYAGFMMAVAISCASRREFIAAGIVLLLVVTFFMLAKTVQASGRISRILAGVAGISFFVGFVALLFVDIAPEIDVSSVVLRIEALFVYSFLLLYPALGFLALAVFYRPAMSMPNHSPDPTLASGTSPAGQEPRHR